MIRTGAQTFGLAIGLAGAMALVLFNRQAVAQDSVTYRNSDRVPQTKTLSGEITNYSGKSLIIKVRDRDVKLDSNRVLSFKTEFTEPHKKAIEAMKANRYAEAYSLLTAARREEKRQWVIRLIISKRVVCLSAIGKPAPAIDDFLLISKVDPATQYFANIPLNWIVSNPESSLQAKAASLIDSPNEAANLIGASWSLSGANRTAAIAKLKLLTESKDLRVAFLAAAQLWRTEIATVNLGKLDKWKSVLKRMPKKLRAGPLTFLASAMLKLDPNSEEAILAFSKVRILHNEQYRLGGYSLLQMAQTLDRMGKTEQADRLWRELLTQFASTEFAVLAKKRLGTTLGSN